jgi:hypothetical protein
LKGATKAAIQAKVEEVPGVEVATVVEFVLTVIEWDEALQAPIGDSFKVVQAKVFIADANGSANQALIDLVDAAIEDVRACGVNIEVIGASPVTVNWNASVQLNPSGPNYAALSNDVAPIESSMNDYLEALAIGGTFSRSLARLTIMNQWGPAGSNDLVDFVTNSPTGDVVPLAFQKIIPGTVSIT